MKKHTGKFFIHLFLLIAALCCFLPFYLVLAGSVTDEAEIRRAGFKFIPEVVSFLAYKYIFINADSVLNSYKVSIIVTAGGTFMSIIVNAMMAYPLSLKRLKYRNAISFYAFFTMLFNGGMVSWYIICVRYLHLYNSFWALMLPYVANAWNMLFIRNYFKGIPAEMGESATIDGAGEFRILFQIMIPLSVPVLATVTLFSALAYWNDWWLGLMLIDKDQLKPLQLLLRNIISNLQFLKTSSNSMITEDLKSRIPSDGLRMATTVVTIGPIVLLYPFIQRYFIKGIIIGAVKG